MFECRQRRTLWQPPGLAGRIKVNTDLVLVVYQAVFYGIAYINPVSLFPQPQVSSSIPGFQMRKQRPKRQFHISKCWRCGDLVLTCLVKNSDS